MCYHVENNQKCPYTPCWDAHNELELRKPNDKLSDEEIELAKVISKTLNVDSFSTMSSGQDFDFNKECEDSDTENFLAEALDDPEEFKAAYSNGNVMNLFLQNMDVEWHLKSYKTKLCIDAENCTNKNCFDAHPNEKLR